MPISYKRKLSGDLTELLAELLVLSFVIDMAIKPFQQVCPKRDLRNEFVIQNILKLFKPVNTSQMANGGIKQ